MQHRSGNTAYLCLLLVVISSLLLAVLGSPNSPTKTRNTSGNSESVHDAMLGRIGASIMAESALIDKETARIYWEGGSTNTLSSSVNNPLQSAGLRHVRATILTFILALILVSFMGNRIRNNLDQVLSPSSGDARSVPLAIIIFLAEWTILKVPSFDRWFICASIVLYLLESYGCSTHTYMNNAISSPSGVEEYIESLRRQPPVATWKVRSFHYERRKGFVPFLALSHVWKRVMSGSDPHQASEALLSTSPSLFTKKVVTHQATKSYEYENFLDSTTAGVWKRAQSTSSTSAAPFTKVTLSKLLILFNEKARLEYFRQQADFVTASGQSDEYAEFSTNIQVEGFKPRLLAVRDIQGVPSAKLFRKNLFWAFTLVGLTVPYRIWFARHCDELRVTVAKETTCDKKSSSWTKSGWFKRTEADIPDDEVFSRRMQKFALYKQSEKNEVETENEPQILANNKEAAILAANCHLSEDNKESEQADTTTAVENNELADVDKKLTPWISGWYGTNAKREVPGHVEDSDPELGADEVSTTSTEPVTLAAKDPPEVKGESEGEDSTVGDGELDVVGNNLFPWTSSWFGISEKGEFPKDVEDSDAAMETDIHKASTSSTKETLLPKASASEASVKDVVNSETTVNSTETKVMDTQSHQ